MSDDDNPGAIDAAFFTIILRRMDKLEDHMESDRLNSGESRRRLHEKIDGIEKSLDNLDRRTEHLEKWMSVTDPLHTEFMAYKQRVIGASIVGRWLRWVAGIIISAAVSAASVYGWMSSHIQIPK